MSRTSPAMQEKKKEEKNDTEYGEKASKLAMAFWGRIDGNVPSVFPRLLLGMGAYWWTSRSFFPVPKGQWPRHGHSGALLQSYQSRTPRIVAWARAAFEQGALPSLLLMPGIAPVFSLPGDRMFQAHVLQRCKQFLSINPFIHRLVQGELGRHMPRYGEKVDGQ